MKGSYGKESTVVNTAFWSFIFCVQEKKSVCVLNWYSFDPSWVTQFSLKKIKEDRGRGEMYNYLKIFLRWVFFSIIQWCWEQENVYYCVSNYRRTLLQFTVSKRQCTFFMSEENYCGHLASNKLRLTSRAYIYLNYFYVCQEKFGLPLYSCLPFSGLYCYSSCFMWRGAWSISSCSTLGE